MPKRKSNVIVVDLSDRYVTNGTGYSPYLTRKQLRDLLIKCDRTLKMYERKKLNITKLNREIGNNIFSK